MISLDKLGSITHVSVIISQKSKYLLLSELQAEDLQKPEHFVVIL
jgi:hypothetical protein